MLLSWQVSKMESTEISREDKPKSMKYSKTKISKHLKMIFFLVSRMLWPPQPHESPLLTRTMVSRFVEKWNITLTHKNVLCQDPCSSTSWYLLIFLMETFTVQSPPLPTIDVSKKKKNTKMFCKDQCSNSNTCQV